MGRIELHLSEGTTAPIAARILARYGAVLESFGFPDGDQFPVAVAIFYDGVNQSILVSETEGIEYIDFKNEKKLMRFTTEQGKIIPRRTSGTCAKHQRQLTRAIKRARHLALMPFIAEIPR